MVSGCCCHCILNHVAVAKAGPSHSLPSPQHIHTHWCLGQLPWVLSLVTPMMLKACIIFSKPYRVEPIILLCALPVRGIIKQIWASSVVAAIFVPPSPTSWHLELVPWSPILSHATVHNYCKNKDSFSLSLIAGAEVVILA